MSKSTIFFQLLLLLIAFPVLISAQNTGSLSGLVIDKKTKEPLIGATISLQNSSMGTTTNLDGFYKFEVIPVGTYNAEVSYLGYLPNTKYNVVIRSANNMAVDFELEQGGNDLDEVVVTVKPFEKSELTPLSIQKLSQEEIVTYPGGNNDVTKVIQSFPGVSGSVGGFRNDVIIRGGAPSENVYYLDGIEIPNINHFATQGSAGGPVGLVNVGFIDNVSLISSAFGANYDNVLSGVLQFEQRRGNNQEFGGNFRVSSSEAALTLEGPLLKRQKEFSNTTYIASVRRSYLQFIFDAIGLPILPDYWDYQYKINHEVDEYNTIYLTGIGSIDNFQVNELDEFDAEQQAIQDQVPVIKQHTNTIGIGWRKRFKDNSGYMVTTLSNNILNNEFTQFTDNVNQEGAVFENDSRETETRLRFNLKRFYEKWTLDYGFSIINADYRNQTKDIVRSFTFDSNLNLFRYGAFIQANTKLIKNRLSLATGIRMDGNTFTNNGNEIYRTLSPRLSAAYLLTENGKWSATASLGRYYKILPYTTLGFQDINGTFINQNTEYIQSNHAVLGLEYLLNDKARFSIEGFYKGYDNYPVSIIDQVSLANKGAGNEVLGSEPVLSEGKGRTYGIEFLFQQKFTGKWYGVAALTLYRSEFSNSSNHEYIPALWDNQVLLSLLGGYKFKRSWEINGRLRLLGGSPYAPLDQTATLESYPILIRDYSNLGDERLGIFSQVDIRIDKKWSFRNWALDVFLEAQNILGTIAPTEPQFGLARNTDGVVEQPRSLIEVPNTTGGELLPAIGIVINF